jgi:hypothetical protein
MGQKNPTREQLKELWRRCTQFVNAQEITCVETISQSDRVIEHAYSFIEDVCEVVGYHDEPEETPPRKA